MTDPKNVPANEAPAKPSDSVVAFANDAKVWAPKELAAQIGVDPKVLRGFLRGTFPRPIEAKNTTWILPNDVAKYAYDSFAVRRATFVTSLLQVTVADAIAPSE